MGDQSEDVTATERERPYGRVALRTPEGQPDLAATGRPVVGMCTTHDQGCCAGCPTAGCRFCACRRDKEACSHV